MAKNLVVVESPAKAKTLAKYLGRNYQVRASVGHILDLPKSKLGVDVENDFQPDYSVIPGKSKVITELRKAAKDKDTVFLAPDPDREGEAIAWHIADKIGVPEAKLKRVEEVALSCRIRPEQDDKRLQVDLNVDKRFVAADLDTFQHD